MVLPWAWSSASSGERATLSSMVAETSGWSVIVTLWMPSSLIGALSATWRRSTVKPAAVAASAASRVETEP